MSKEKSSKTKVNLSSILHFRLPVFKSSKKKNCYILTIIITFGTLINIKSSLKSSSDKIYFRIFYRISLTNIINLWENSFAYYMVTNPFRNILTQFYDYWSLSIQ